MAVSFAPTVFLKEHAGKLPVVCAGSVEKELTFAGAVLEKPAVLPRRAQAAVFSFPAFERMVRYNLEGKDAIDANSSELCLRRNLNLKRPLRELPEDLNPFRGRLSSNLVHADKDGCVLGWINRDHGAEP
jgi:hypothetical protein